MGKGDERCGRENGRKREKKMADEWRKGRDREGRKEKGERNDGRKRFCCKRLIRGGKP